VGKKKLLFVDDEAAIRMTLPAILEQKGFEVKTAASVPEAVEIINKERFDVLISDLNIGQPSDGFTVVSVMRRVQPEAVTFILTGFPDFESALKAIRNQVDDFLTKPADIPMLVATLERKLANRRPSRSIPTQRAPELLLEHLDEVLQHWLLEVNGHSELKELRISADACLGSVPNILSAICGQVLKGQEVLGVTTLAYATEHGISRLKQGYRAEWILTESRLLQRTIIRFFQEHMLALDLSTLISDLMHISDLIATASELSLRSFHGKV
jgi:ActR/RegA family two-component response regulator